MNEHAPYLADRDGHLWKRVGDGYVCRNVRPPVRYATLARSAGPLTPLWPDTPAAQAPTPNNDALPDLTQWHEVPVGAVVPAGVTYAVAWENNFEVSVRSANLTHAPGWPRRFTAQPIPAPDPDADLVASIIEADSPEVARTLIATIRGEQR